MATPLAAYHAAVSTHFDRLLQALAACPPGPIPEAVRDILRTVQAKFHLAIHEPEFDVRAEVERLGVSADTAEHYLDPLFSCSRRPVGYTGTDSRRAETFYRQCREQWRAALDRLQRLLAGRSRPQEQPPPPRAKQTATRSRRKTTSELMQEAMDAEPGSTGWTLQQFSERTGRSVGSCYDTDQWRTIMKLREEAEWERAERQSEGMPRTGRRKRAARRSK
jgi:hypothetical protein